MVIQFQIEESAKKRKGSRHEINSIKENKKSKKEPSKDPRVYCICREEERPGMIGCDYCDEWYHTQCLSLSKGEVQRLANEKWSCPNCEFKMGKVIFNFNILALPNKLLLN